MTRAEWNQCCAVVLGLWPLQGWPDVTIEAGWHLCGEFSIEAVQRAVMQIAAEGKEFAPPPGVVAAYAQPHELQLRPGLPDPERLREPTAEERARNQRGITPLAWAELSSAWGTFEKHAAATTEVNGMRVLACRRCRVVRDMVANQPTPPARLDLAELLEVCCEEGRPPFDAWRLTVAGIMEERRGASALRRTAS